MVEYKMLLRVRTFFDFAKRSITQNPLYFFQPFPRRGSSSSSRGLLSIHMGKGGNERNQVYLTNFLRKSNRIKVE